MKVSFCSGVLACMAWSVGRLVGRSVVRKGSCNRRSVVRKGSCNRRSVVQKCSCSRLRVPRKMPKLGPYEGMRPFPKWVRPPPAMAVEEVSSGEGDVEMEVPSGSSAARPPEVPKAPQLLSGTGTEGITDAEMMELRIIMGEGWSPPYRSPPAVWSCHGPLEHNQTGYFDFCLLCGKWLSQGHLQSDSHMRQMERWLRADKPALAIPHDRFMDHESLEMLIQARHPLWSSNMVLSAKERVLQMEFFEAQEGVYTGEIPAEFGSGRPEEEAAASAARPAPEAEASAARPAPPTSTEEPREKKPRRTEPPPPKSGRKREKPRRTKPWPDTHGVALRSSAQMERMGGVAPPLGPGISAQAVFEVESEDETWSDWRGVKASLRVAPRTPPKYPQRPSTPPMPPRAGPMSDVAMGSTDLPLPPPPLEAPPTYSWTPSYYSTGPRAIYSSPSGRVLPYTAPARPGDTSRAGRVGSCQGRGPGSAGQGEDVVFISTATPGGSSGADSRAGGIIDDGAFAGTSSSSAIGGVGYHASPEASEKGGESTAVTSLREVDVRHFVAPLQPQCNDQQIGKNELSVVPEPLHVVRDFALPVHGESSHAVQGESSHAVQGERVHSSACEFCGHLFAAPVQDPNIKNNQEPDTRHRDPAAGLGLAADQGELFLSSDPETRRELHKRLSHVSQGHVPHWANCEACNRSRGLTPARMRGDRPEKEYQVDQFMYRSRCFIILVHVLAFAVAVTFRPEGMSGREASTYLEPWLAHFGLSRRGDTKPSFYSNPEPLTISIAQALAERYEGHSESFAPEHHAPVAERAVRTLDCVFS